MKNRHYFPYIMWVRKTVRRIAFLLIILSMTSIIVLLMKGGISTHMVTKWTTWVPALISIVLFILRPWKWLGEIQLSIRFGNDWKETFKDDPRLIA